MNTQQYIFKLLTTQVNKWDVTNQILQLHNYNPHTGHHIQFLTLTQDKLRQYRVKKRLVNL